MTSLYDGLNNDLVTFYLYKIDSKRKITFRKNSINFVNFVKINEIKAVILSQGKENLIYDSEDDVQFVENIVLELSTNQKFSLDNDTFYVFSSVPRENFENIQDFIDQSFYFEGIIENFEDNLETEESAVEFTLKMTKTLEKIKYVFFMRMPKWKNLNSLRLNTLDIAFSSVKGNLINSISLFAKDFESNLVPLNFTNFSCKYYPTMNFFPFFMNCIFKSEREQKHYLRTLDYNFHLNYLTLLPFLTNDDTTSDKVNLKLNIKKFLNNDESLYETLKKCLEVTKTLLSNFAGKTTQQIEAWKKNYTYANDPAIYCDAIIYEQVTRLEILGEKFLLSKFLAIILAFSEYIKSSYCWKGGLTYEHKTMLLIFINIPIYFALDDIFLNNKFFLDSLFFNFNGGFAIAELENLFLVPKNKIMFPFNKNIGFLNDKIFQYPILDEQISEVNVFQNPKNFNNDIFKNIFFIPLEEKEANFLYSKKILNTVSSFQEIVNQTFVETTWLSQKPIIDPSNGLSAEEYAKNNAPPGYIYYPGSVTYRKETRPEDPRVTSGNYQNWSAYDPRNLIPGRIETISAKYQKTTQIFHQSLSNLQKDFLVINSFYDWWSFLTKKINLQTENIRKIFILENLEKSTNLEVCAFEIKGLWLKHLGFIFKNKNFDHFEGGTEFIINPKKFFHDQVTTFFVEIWN